MGCAPVAASIKTIYVEVPMETVKEVTKTVYVSVPTEITVYVPTYREPREFSSSEELKQYLHRPAIMTGIGQDCDDVARFFQEDALKEGFLVSCQYVEHSPISTVPHMLDMAIISSENAIYYIEPQTMDYWYAMPLD
jgi:hypothetical protein